MDPDHFAAAFFKWDQRPSAVPTLYGGGEFEFGVSNAVAAAIMSSRKELSSLEELFRNYGVKHMTLTKMVEMGFTVNTLVNMTEHELDEVVRTLEDIYHLDLLVGEKYGIKSAIRAKRRRLDEAERKKRMELFVGMDGKRKIDESNVLDTLSQPHEGSSIEERFQAFY